MSESLNAKPKCGRRGEGGGRPRRPGEKVRLSLDVSPEAAALLKVEAMRSGRPMWEVLEQLVKVGLPDAQGGPTPPLSPAVGSDWLLTGATAPAPPPDDPSGEHLARLVCKAFLPHITPEKALETARAMVCPLPPGPH